MLVSFYVDYASGCRNDKNLKLPLHYKSIYTTYINGSIVLLTVKQTHTITAGCVSYFAVSMDGEPAGLLGTGGPDPNSAVST